MHIRTHPLFEGLTLTKRSVTEYTVFTLKVGRVYKGSLPELVRVATGIGTADGTAAPDCSFPFEVGKDYLIYAQAGVSEYGGLLSTSVCDCTGMINGARFYALGTEMYLRHLQGRPAREEDKLSIEEASRFYESRATAQISGRIRGTEKQGLLEDGLWHLLDGQWHRWSIGFPDLAQDGSYAFRWLEPGEYRIGFFQILEDGSRKVGFYGGSERLEEAQTILVGPGEHINGIDIDLKLPSSNAVQGKIECPGEKAPNGRIKLRVANSWDRYMKTNLEVEPCGSFRIPGIYSGKFRVIATLEPDSLDPQDAWTVNVPEIMVPEQAGNVILKLERERLAEQATSPSYPIWDIWTGKVRQILDGDEIVIEVGKGSNREARKLRIAGIICPAKGQSQREEAKRFTAKLLLGKTLTFILPESESSSGPMEYEDSPGLNVGKPITAAMSVEKELLKAGLAWHYKKYSADPELDRLEAEARKAGRGIWSDPSSARKSQSKPRSNQ